MSSGDQLSACTVCGQQGHWESSHAADAENLKEVRRMLNVVLDQVDYTQGNCKLNDMVGAVITSAVLKEARATL